MNKEYNERVDFMINNSKDVRRYLKSTPFSNDPTLNFNKALSIDYFFDHFFASSDIAEEAKKAFYDAVDDLSQIVLITGYKGCGKTTFIRHITRNQRAKSINFDKFYNTSEPIKGHLVSELYDDICKDWELKRLTLKNMLDIFHTPTNRKFIDRKIDPFNNIIDFFNKCKLLYEIKQAHRENEATYFQDIKMSINNLNINQILLLIVFWDISYRIAYEKECKCNIIFDNLDAIHETEELQKLMLEFVVFYNNTTYIIDNISHPQLAKPNYNAFQDFIFIFAMRETTKAKLTEHFNDRIFGDYHYCDVSTIFIKNEFVSKRYDYLINNPNLKNKHLECIVKKIKQMLDDQYIRDNIFPLFNNDYRTVVDVLTAVFDDTNKLKEYCDLLRSEYDFVRFGARGILFRKIFNLLLKENYFAALQATETSMLGKNKQYLALNTSRIVLTFLTNYANEYRAKEYLQDKPGVSLLTIFTDLEPVCDLKAIISSLWTMFELKEQQYWNHLITFDFLSIASYEQLENELDRYNQGNRNYNKYPCVRISCAGKVYLNTVLPHYEYMASRVFSNNNEPLFLSMRQIAKDYYMFEQILEGVYQEVTDCCRRLKQYYKNVFCEKANYKDEEFLGSRFAYHKLDENDKYRVSSMFHGERIIHSHISYIDAFRKYALLTETNEIKKSEINKKIINYIKKYIRLFDNQSIGQPSSVQTKSLVQSYNKCIEVIEQVNYMDFTTSIDNQTGRKLLERKGENY